MGESYALLQHSLAELDAEAVGHALDEAPWLARADARMLVRRAHGILVDNLARDEAEALARALGEHGVSVEVVEQAWLRLPRVSPCRRASMDAQALSIHDLYGRVTRVPWSRVLLLGACSYLSSERKTRSRSTLEHALSSYGHTAFQEKLTSSQVEYTEEERVILDVVVDLPARYRIEPDRFDYGYLGERRAAGAAANFPLVVKDLIERAPHAVQTRGLRSLASQSRKAARYPGLHLYEREVAWSVWRYLGPGTRLDIADPYRSRSAPAPRLRAPLGRSSAGPAPDPAAPGRPAARGPRAGSLVPAGNAAAELRAAKRMADAGITIAYGLVIGFVLGFSTGSGLPLLIAPPLALGLRYLRRRHRRRRDPSGHMGHVSHDDAAASGDESSPEPGRGDL